MSVKSNPRLIAFLWTCSGKVANPTLSPSSCKYTNREVCQKIWIDTWNKYQMEIEVSLLVAISSFYRGYSIDPWTELQITKSLSDASSNYIFNILHTHSVCETICDVGTRSSVEFCCQNHREYPILCKEYPLCPPPPPKNGASRGWASGKSWLIRTPPPPPQRIGASHEGLRYFGFDLTKNTPSLQIHQFLDTYHLETVWYYLPSYILTLDILLIFNISTLISCLVKFITAPHVTINSNI